MAHLKLISLPTAGVWLTNPPTEDGRGIDSPLFSIALKRRLRIPVVESDVFCPCCGDCLDSFGDHALVCSCKGDRVVRHNAIRNVFYEEAGQASLRPEREKAGLLPKRPLEDGLGATTGTRRPADVWFPRGPDGRGVAHDFACTSGLRSDLLARTVENPFSVFEAYEDFKRGHLDTERSCEEQGFAFQPMVLEAHAGAWSLAARRVLETVARGQAATWNEKHEAASLLIAQRLSAALHRENARAVMKRIAKCFEDVPRSSWEGFMEAPECE